MLIYAVFLVLAIVTSAEVNEVSDVSEVADVKGQKTCAESDWVKVSPHTVCFGTKGDRYGSFYNYIRGGMVTAIKLEYVSGKVRCAAGVQYDSRWGCNGYALFANFPLNVVVTDDKNHIMWPKKEFINGVYPKALWYWSPFVNPSDSNQLIFTDYSYPFFFPLDKEMRIWYGEDLKNWKEYDNTGRVCVNVYAKFKS